MDSEVIIAYVGLGSNLGDRAGNLLLAVRGLMEAGLCVHKLSGIYETEPVGVTDHSNYLNMAAEVHVSGITPSQMMTRMLRIEYLLGRKDKFLQKPRSVDLDLLLFDGIEVDSELVKIPHPQMHERRFVLVPLAEIAPHAIHPGLQKTAAELLATVEDTSLVHRWSPNTNVVFEHGEMKLSLKTLKTMT